MKEAISGLLMNHTAEELIKEIKAQSKLQLIRQGSIKVPLFCVDVDCGFSLFGTPKNVDLQTQTHSDFFTIRGYTFKIVRGVRRGKVDGKWTDIDVFKLSNGLSGYKGINLICHTGDTKQGRFNSIDGNCFMVGEIERGEDGVPTLVEIIVYSF